MVSREDVARRAGVSVSTVSYALTGSRPVSAKTRQRIETAVRELGYTPNPLARGLVKGRTGLIALQIPVNEGGLQLTDLDYLEGATAAAQSLGFHLLIWTARADDPTEFRAIARQGIADGVLLMEVTRNDPRVAVLRELATPLALIGRSRTDDPEDYSDSDFNSVGPTLIPHLMNHGHRAMLFLSRSDEAFHTGHGPTVRMEQSVADSANASGITMLIRHVPSTLRAGWEETERVLNEHPEVTAIVSINELAMTGAIAAARDRGLRVPENISLVALGLSEASAELHVPALSTVSAVAADISRIAVHALARRLEQPGLPPQHHLAPMTFVDRGSIGPAAPRA